MSTVRLREHHSGEEEETHQSVLRTVRGAAVGTRRRVDARVGARRSCAAVRSEEEKITSEKKSGIFGERSLRE